MDTRNPADRLLDTEQPLVDTISRMVTDLHDRLRAAEVVVAALNANQSTVVDSMVMQITNQFSELFTAADQLVTAIRNAEFLSATTETPVSFMVGLEATLMLDAGDNFPFVPSSVVGLVIAGNADDYAFAKVTGWVPSTRELSIEIFAAAGAAGPHAGVTVEIAALNTLAVETIRSDVSVKYSDILLKYAAITEAAGVVTAAIEVIQDGPVAAVNGQTGVVVLDTTNILRANGTQTIEQAFGALDGGTFSA